MADLYDNAYVISRATEIPGVDPDDPNSIIVNTPVTKQVGGATVHTGERLASDGTLSDVADKSGQSNFDALL